MKTPLIIGGDGTVGCALAAKLRAMGLSPSVTTRRKGSEGVYLDLAAAPESWANLPKADMVFLCAAAAKLEACEDDPTATRSVNVEGMKAVAARVQEKDGFVVFISSNQVFDGSRPYMPADASVCPLNEYGQQKAVMERWLLARPQPAAVLRLTKVIPGTLPILAEWEKKLTAGKNISAFGDLRFAPVPLTSVIEALVDLGQKKKPGMYHLSGTGDISYYELACALAETLGATGRVMPSSPRAAGIRPQFLPKYGTLDNATMAHIAVPEPLDCFHKPLRAEQILLRNSAHS